jgi:hypothetical protein
MGQVAHGGKISWLNRWNDHAANPGPMRVGKHRAWVAAKFNGVKMSVGIDPGHTRSK